MNRPQRTTVPYVVADVGLDILATAVLRVTPSRPPAPASAGAAKEHRGDALLFPVHASASARKPLRRTKFANSTKPSLGAHRKQSRPPTPACFSNTAPAPGATTPRAGIT